MSKKKEPVERYVVTPLGVLCRVLGEEEGKRAFEALELQARRMTEKSGGVPAIVWAKGAIGATFTSVEMGGRLTNGAKRKRLVSLQDLPKGTDGVLLTRAFARIRLHNRRVILRRATDDSEVVMEYRRLRPEKIVSVERVRLSNEAALATHRLLTLWLSCRVLEK